MTQRHKESGARHLGTKPNTRARLGTPGQRFIRPKSEYFHGRRAHSCLLWYSQSGGQRNNSAQSTPLDLNMTSIASSAASLRPRDPSAQLHSWTHSEALQGEWHGMPWMRFTTLPTRQTRRQIDRPTRETVSLPTITDRPTHPIHRTSAQPPRHVRDTPFCRAHNH